jgi:hypothetical protein
MNLAKVFCKPYLAGMTKHELIAYATRLGFSLGFNSDGTVDVSNRSGTCVIRGQTFAEVEEGLRGIDNPMLRDALQKPFVGPKS